MDSTRRTELRPEDHSEKIRALEAGLSENGIEYDKDLPLSSCSTFRIGGPADIAVSPRTAEELALAVRLAKSAGLPFHVAGNGSNMLYDDEGFRGVLVQTQKLRGIGLDGCVLTAGSGASLMRVTRAAAAAGLSGFEFAYGIPGSVGGAVFMNAGAYGGQIADIFAGCSVLDSSDGSVRRLTPADMDFSYRHSVLAGRRELLLLEASFSLDAGGGTVGEITGRMHGLMERRIDKQPLDLPSAGSVFRRPAPDIYVGKLIEDSGLKGSSVGGAAVSVKHAGFIVNTGGATSADVTELIKRIKEKIASDHGVVLECEIRHLSPDGTEEPAG